MRNEHGSLLVDALLALVLTACMALFLVSALYSYQRIQKQAQQERKGVDVYELYQLAQGLYDD